MEKLLLHNKCSHKRLINYGFIYDGIGYKLSYPLYKSNDKAVIIINIKILLHDKYIGYDIIDNNSKMIYVPFYSKDYMASNAVLENIKLKLDNLFFDMKQNQIII